MTSNDQDRARWISAEKDLLRSLSEIERLTSIINDDRKLLLAAYNDIATYRAIIGHLRLLLEEWLYFPQEDTESKTEEWVDQLENFNGGRR